MTSSLTWVDYDSEARDRSLRILSLFQQRESRDELGFGAIRDSFADKLFPGTSTIQTRIRYMLFVPWIYQMLEDKKVKANEFGDRASKLELRLVQPLLQSEDSVGAFGKVSGSKLQRLPSSVYWAGLGSWGIRTFDTSQDQYHSRIDQVYLRRSIQSNQSKDNLQRGDGSDVALAAETFTWHPNIPAPPQDLFDQANFLLSLEEATFLRERITLSHPDSFLAWLVGDPKPINIASPWQHPNMFDISSEHKALLYHARLFSVVMHGASLLYNVLLADASAWRSKKDEYVESFQLWCEELDEVDITGWALSELWELVIDLDHRVTPAARDFVQSWVGLVKGDKYGLLRSSYALNLVKNREISLKKNQSRFVNRDALQQWGGASGVGRLNYRWQTAQTFLNDLSKGINEGV